MNRFYERVKRTEWMMHDRFGMFIHWGIYAVAAKGEWMRSMEQVSNEDYKPYFDEFNPTDYNPREWAKLAKRAGMKYAVITTKHHDGFCLFDSKLTDYKATNTPAGRDLIQEFVDAFRAEGLKVGLYYSLVDWHHADYPKYGHSYHPERNNEKHKGEEIDFDNYIKYFHGQVKELLTNYGKIDIMWYDFSYEDMTGEKWQATKLIKMMREIQPHIVIDNRLEAHVVNESNENPYDAFTAGEIEEYTGDFVSPEHIIPPNGMVDSKGTLLPWEACVTLNSTWGYNANDRNFKTPQHIIRALVECTSKGGNLLLNIGPDAKGNIQKEAIQLLTKVGEWMDENSASIYGCTRARFPKPEWGRYTQNGNKLYAHILDRGINAFNFQGLKSVAKSARMLRDGSELELTVPRDAMGFLDDIFADRLPQHLPDMNDTVVEITLKEER